MFSGPFRAQKPRRREVAQKGFDSRLRLQERACRDG